MSRLTKVAIVVLLTCTSVLTSVQALSWMFIRNPDALCNDFTPAGYYIRKNDSSSNWIVFLESGGACYSADTCNRRYCVYMCVVMCSCYICISLFINSLQYLSNLVKIYVQSLPLPKEIPPYYFQNASSCIFKNAFLYLQNNIN